MKARYVGDVMIAAALAFALVGCGKKETTTETQPSAPAGPAATPIDMATVGSLSGTVKLDGTPPKPKRINMAAEPFCNALHASTPSTDEEVVAGGNGTLGNVIVYVKEGIGNRTFETPKSPVSIDQKGCQYSPHVVAMQAGQMLNVVNSDKVTHNIHPVPKVNREWNKSQPPGAPPIEEVFAREEVTIPVKCNVHPWMKSYIAVFKHPYFQVTGNDGSFELKNLPPGTYTIEAWHEKYGTSDQSVTIGPKESKTVSFVFKAAGAGD
ncbi:MAG TPA: carboxypeptidase regulatory-like domain-containing protein [Candidatus Acidoferrales bacterium]|nr:carboxypeptidase regulatory-like domain-containing protein [Candidatus Acidoferrales bacterium]